TLRTPEAEELLRSYNADIFIVTAYGKILPQNILDIPRLGCVNLHASLLPKLRGAAPINRAVMNGDTLGGVTLMYMDAGMDTGDIIAKREVEIPFGCDAGQYHNMLAEAGTELLAEFLKDTAEGKPIPREKQNGNEATYADKITSEDTHIDFAKPAIEVYNRIRGLNPFPCPYFTLGGKRIKVKKAALGGGSGKPGEVISLEGGIGIACGSGSVIVQALCPEGKSATDALSYLRGNKLEIGRVVND
ncbi:MAG: methionyl-tRNA formyltransferase, partial [Clostridia bacterium]|nr:methionyl-tRNA formyltransferase [Clostridia bacterium]